MKSLFNDVIIYYFFKKINKIIFQSSVLLLYMKKIYFTFLYLKIIKARSSFLSKIDEKNIS